jgi:hypothetical protein
MVQETGSLKKFLDASQIRLLPPDFAAQPATRASYNTPSRRISSRRVAFREVNPGERLKTRPSQA